MPTDTTGGSDRELVPFPGPSIFPEPNEKCPECKEAWRWHTYTVPMPGALALRCP